MRACFFALFLTLFVSFPLVAEVVARFTPLADNERFAYDIESFPASDGSARRVLMMTLYAVRGNDIENASTLFSWSVHGWGSVQFTGDFRTAFFSTRQMPEDRRTLFKADGATGEIRAVASGLDGGRVSTDGRFFVSIDARRRTDREQANILLLDIENDVMTPLQWRTKGRIEAFWLVFRFGNVFRIYGTQDGGRAPIVAAAYLNPETMEITVLWDHTDIDFSLDPSPPQLPEIHGEDWQYWQDDVARGRNDPNIRLRR